MNQNILVAVHRFFLCTATRALYRSKTFLEPSSSAVGCPKISGVQVVSWKYWRDGLGEKCAFEKARWTTPARWRDGWFLLVARVPPFHQSAIFVSIWAAYMGGGDTERGAEKDKEKALLLWKMMEVALIVLEVPSEWKSEVDWIWCMNHPSKRVDLHDILAQVETIVLTLKDKKLNNCFGKVLSFNEWLPKYAESINNELIEERCSLPSRNI